MNPLKKWANDLRKKAAPVDIRPPSFGLPSFTVPLRGGAWNASYPRTARRNCGPRGRTPSISGPARA